MAANYRQKGGAIADRLDRCRQLRIAAIVLAILTVAAVLLDASQRPRQRSRNAVALMHMTGGSPAITPSGRPPRLPAANQDMRMAPQVPFPVPQSHYIFRPSGAGAWRP